MKLYHGSNKVIEQIDLSYSKVGKDFGCGFYLSPTQEQAGELAKRKTEQIGEGVSTITSFEFDESLLESEDFRYFVLKLILKNGQNSY